ncbi:uncharacterized protein At4g18257-like [Wolffia australiana]
MAGEWAERKEKRAGAMAESLGWLTESTIMPKKHRAIEGVGASSILELKAQLYRAQEEARRDKQGGDAVEHLRAKRKTPVPDVFSRKNSGVDSRAHRDKLELKAVQDGSVSYAALEKKAELYEKLSRGEIPDEDEIYCVDFFHKSCVQLDTETEDDNRVKKEEEEEEEEDAKMIGPGRAGLTMDRDEHKRFVREVHEEASEAREKATELKIRRQEQEAARRDRLRQAYLKKRLEKVKAASQVGPT